MDPLAAVTHNIDQLLQQAVRDGLLDDQFLQLMQLQVGPGLLVSWPAYHVRKLSAPRWEGCRARRRPPGNAALARKGADPAPAAPPTAAAAAVPHAGREQP